MKFKIIAGIAAFVAVMGVAGYLHAQSANLIPVAGELVSATGQPIIEPDIIHTLAGDTHDNLDEYIKANNARIDNEIAAIQLTPGPQGAFDYPIHQCAENKPAQPAGGVYHFATHTISNVPAGWSIQGHALTCTDPAILWVARAVVNEALGENVPLQWGSVVQDVGTPADGYVSDITATITDTTLDITLTRAHHADINAVAVIPQADWDEADDTALAHILNKPDIYTQAEVRDLLQNNGGRLILGTPDSYDLTEHTIFLTTTHPVRHGDEVYFQMPPQISNDHTGTVGIRWRVGSDAYSDRFTLTDIDGISHNPDDFSANRLYTTIFLANHFRLIEPLVGTEREEWLQTWEQFDQNRGLTYNSNTGDIDLSGIPHPPPDIELVSRLPLATDDSADIIYLTHDYTTGGREDAHMTIERFGSEAGYSIGAPFGAHGSIDKKSPLRAFIGANRSGGYDLQSIVSANEHWIRNIHMVSVNGNLFTVGTPFYGSGVWEVRITGGGLDNISPGLTTHTINFFDSAGQAYWTDASATTDKAGIYQKVEVSGGTGFRYYQLIYAGLIHVDGTGLGVCPEPTRAAQSCVDDEGKLWVSGDVISPAGDPSIDSISVFADNYYLPDATPGLDLCNVNGGFTIWNAQLAQCRGSSVSYGRTWEQVWSYIVDQVSSTAQTREYRDDWRWLGLFSNRAEAAEARQNQLDDTKTYTYSVHNLEIYEITAFTRGTVSITHDYFWRGPLTNLSDVLDAISENHNLLIQREDGTHEAASSHTERRLLYDGHDLRYTNRQLIPAHGASATFTDIPENTTITLSREIGNCTTLRWRGFHYTSARVSSPQHCDFYHNYNSNRVYVRNASASWIWQSNGSSLIQDARIDTNLFDTQAGALAHVDGNGDRMFYRDANTTKHFAIVSNYVEPEPEHVTWTWESAGFGGLSPEFVMVLEELLVLFEDDATMTTATIVSDGVGYDPRNAGNGSNNKPIPSGTHFQYLAAFPFTSSITDFAGRILFVTNESQNAEAYDGATIRWGVADPRDYTLEAHDYLTANNHQRYRTTSTVHHIPTAGSTIVWNVEDVQHESPFDGVEGWWWHRGE